MTYQSLFMLATAGVALWAVATVIDRRMARKARRLHARAKALGQVHKGIAKAQKMVQHQELTMNQRTHVHTYIDLLEQRHDSLCPQNAYKFDQLRQTLIRNNRGVRAVV